MESVCFTVHVSTCSGQVLAYLLCSCTEVEVVTVVLWTKESTQRVYCVSFNSVVTTVERLLCSDRDTPVVCMYRFVLL